MIIKIRKSNIKLHSDNIYTSAIYHLFGFKPAVLKTSDISIKVNIIGELDIVNEAIILLEGVYIGTCNDLLRKVICTSDHDAELIPGIIMIESRKIIQKYMEAITSSTEFMQDVIKFTKDHNIPIPNYSTDVMQIVDVALNTNHRM